MMWQRGCEHEDAIRQMARAMARGDAVDPVLREHAATCASCQETLTVASWMLELAETPVPAGPLPDPKYLWWKADMLRRWEAEQRATAPIETGEHVQVSVGLIAAVLLAATLWLSPGTITTRLETGVIAVLCSAMLLATGAGVVEIGRAHV